MPSSTLSTITALLITLTTCFLFWTAFLLILDYRSKIPIVFQRLKSFRKATNTKEIGKKRKVGKFIHRLFLYRVQRHLTAQLPDTLDALSQAVQAGYSFPQALEFVGRESSEPVRDVLKEATDELRFNFSLEDVLMNLRKKWKNRDFGMAIDGLVMQLKIGGNIAEMMKKMAGMIRERLALEKDIRAATSQGRLSGVIIALMWPLSIALFYLISPEYITILFSTGIGQFLLIFAAILEILGFYIIWKITNVSL